MATALAPETSVPFLPWEDFLPAFDWRQGEHVTILGTTGGGKTTIMRAILPARKYRVVFASKPQDPLISSLRSEGYEILRQWPPHPHVHRAVFWPNIRKMSDASAQSRAFYDAFFDIYQRGGWAIGMDETAYLARTLGLGNVLKFLYEQSRSLRISLVTLSQRPKEIPLLAYSCATHLFLLRETDLVNVKRLSEISGVNSAIVKEEVQSLPKYHALYINTRDGQMFTTKAERRRG